MKNIYGYAPIQIVIIGTILIMMILQYLVVKDVVVLLKMICN
jgi:hypothetical protein